MKASEQHIVAFNLTRLQQECPELPTDRLLEPCNRWLKTKWPKCKAQFNNGDLEIHAPYPQQVAAAIGMQLKVEVLKLPHAWFRVFQLEPNTGVAK